MRASALAVVALLAGGPVATAQESVAACGDATTQAAMNECAAADFEAADEALNALWRQAVVDARERDAAMADGAREPDAPTREATLRAAERAWVAYRDAQCRYESDAARGGSMQPMLVGQCRARITRERIEELKNALEGLGD